MGKIPKFAASRKVLNDLIKDLKLHDFIKILDNPGPGQYNPNP